MAQVDFSAAYRDSTRGSTLKALAERKKAAAEAQLSAMAPRQIASPWQGAAQITETIGAGIREGRIAAEENAGRQRLAELLTGGLTADEMGEATILDPELAMKHQERAWTREDTEETRRIEEQRLLREHGWDVDAATQRAREASELSKQGAEQQLVQQNDQQSADILKQQEKVRTDAEVAKQTAKTEQERIQIQEDLDRETARLQEQLDRRTAELQSELDTKKTLATKETFRDMTPEERKAAGIAEGVIAQVNEITGEKKVGDYPSQGPAQQAMDVQTAKDVQEWESGGKVSLANNMAQINEALKALEPGSSMLGETGENLGLGQTGPVAGLVPEAVHQFLNPDMIVARDAIRSAVQSTLKATLGTQFAAIEGQQLLDRAFSMSARPEENVRRAKLIMEQLAQVAQVKDAQAEWSRTHGGLMKGFVPPPIDLEAIKANLDTMFKGEGGTGSGAPASTAPDPNDPMGLFKK